MEVPAPAVGSGQDGQFLRGEDLSERFEGSERPEIVLTSDKGIRHERDGETKTVSPGGDCAAVAAITDERVLLVVGGNSDDQGNPDRSVSLPYTEIRSVETSTGVLKSRLTITARTSDRYHFLVGGRQDLADIETAITRAVTHWVAVDRRLGKAKEHLSTIDDHLEDGNPEAAADAYRRTRELIEEATDVAETFRDERHAMHRRIDQVETRLALTKVHGHRIRAEQHVADAEAALDDGDFQGAFDGYRDALEQYDRARSLADAVDYHETDDLEERESEIRQALSQIKTGPLVSAMDACEAALATADPEEAVEAWQRALRQCHDAVTLVHRDEGFDGDYDALRWQVEWAAANLLDAHDRVVDRAERRGDEQVGTNADAAAAAYRVALGHTKRALTVAAEFRAGSADAYRERAAALRTKLDALLGG